MRILLVTGIFPPDIGGPATYVPRIAEALTARGHRVAVIAASDAAAQDDRAYSFAVERIPRRPRARRVFRVVTSIRRAARSCDVILANSMHLEAFAAARTARCPVILKLAGDWAWERARQRGWVHDDFETFQRARYSPRVESLRAIRAAVVRRADRVLAPSHYLGRWARAWGAHRDQVEVIYNSTHSAAYPAPAPLPWGDRPTLITVGRLVAWKHIDRLIELLRELDGAGLVIVGEGALLDSLRRLAEAQGVAERVYFAGKRSQEETFALLAACDVFVLNSSYEGLPHVVLEAMQAGIPVIATDAGGTSELVENGVTGTLVPMGASAEMSAAVRALLGSPELRARRVEQARARLADFSFDRMLAQTEDLLERVARRPAA